MGSVPPKLTPAQVAVVVTMKANGRTQQEIADHFGVHRNTIGRIFWRLKNEREPVKLKPCGTNAAYWRHKRKKEPACTPCLLAHAADRDARVKADPNYKEKRKKWNDARYARARIESQSTGVPIRALITAARSSRAK